MTSCWLDQLGRIVWKGLSSFFLFYGRQDIKSLGKRPTFAKTLSNTSAFTCHRGNGRLSSEKKQSVCSIPTPKTFWQIREFLGAEVFC
jgi:hypothetical protein